ncbi:hypothetical protein LCGC14_0176550 [marine sediment metagenome]|uniref:UDP N-acetylglucosamine O-acyltransferase C-terminal domain-containing protein n=1 Tax=marine sediment metagenome TaxID=412755 RepID=A0A0F9X9Y7_9ZZZZ
MTSNIISKGEIHETAIIGDDVKIGKNVTIYPYVVIEGIVEIQKDVTIHSFTNISESPEHKYLSKNDEGKVFIGEKATLFQHTAITIPTTSKETHIGKRAFLMGGAHIGHDCIVMDDGIVGGNGMMAGHSVLGKGAFLGDSATIHQWTVVGAHSMIGMNCPVRHNVLPFTIAYGSPPFWKNINQIGFDRSGIPIEEKYFLEAFYTGNINEYSLLGLTKKLEELKSDIGPYPTMDALFREFIDQINTIRKSSNTNKGKFVRWKE